MLLVEATRAVFARMVRCSAGVTTGEVRWATAHSRTAATHPDKSGRPPGWTAVGPGDTHTCAIRNGALYCFGENTSGELGNGTSTSPEDPDHGNPNPTQVGTATDWTDIAGGAGASCGIRADNLLFCWGNGASGDGSTTPYTVPTQAQFDKWWSISVGGFHKLGLRSPQG